MVRPTWQSPRRPSQCCPQRSSRLRAVYLGPDLAEAAEEHIDSDFYAILGVSPRADRRVIKQAYYNIMKEYHPDSGADSTDFCAMLNEIYATLSDPGKRSVYNDMAGFSESAVNPFLDAAAERDQVFVDEATCIGCKACAGVCPSTFFMDELHGRARAVKSLDGDEMLQEAIDVCPVTCIHWVTAGQLPLLEVAMAKMERNPVWSLLSGGGRGESVFSEAGLAWAKRQSILREQIIASRQDAPSRAGSPAPAPVSSNWWSFSWDNPLVDRAGAGGAARWESAFPPTHDSHTQGGQGRPGVWCRCLVPRACAPAALQGGRPGGRAQAWGGVPSDRTPATPGFVMLLSTTAVAAAATGRDEPWHSPRGASTHDASGDADEAGGGGSGSWDEQAARAGASSVGARETKNIAGLAARASRTARTWKKYQEVLRNVRGGRRALLPAASSPSS
ncbi:MAG: hypothetical protein WDW36_007688 [Sanguina aurantia]